MRFAAEGTVKGDTAGVRVLSVARRAEVGYLVLISIGVHDSDGNLVIYGSGNGAVWASGTNGQGMNVDEVVIVPASQQADATLQLRSEGRVKWSSDVARRS